VVLKILILVLLEYVVDLQTVLSVMNALRAFLILSVCTSIVLTDYAAQVGKFWYLLNLLVIKKEWLVVGGVDAYFFCFADIDFQADFGSFTVQSL